MENSFDNYKLLENIDSILINKYINNSSFVIKNYNTNNILHFEGEPCNVVEIILEGKVVVERIDESGNLMNIAEFVSDDLLGGNLVFSKNPYYPMTITSKSQCRILEINKDVLFSLFTDNPKFLKTYLQYISDHAYMLGDKIKHYVNRTIRESIMSFLEHESKVHNSKKVVLKMTKTALSEKIGIQRTSLSRELNKMKKIGMIDFDIGSITILYDF